MSQSKADNSWTNQAIHFIDFEGNRRSGILEFGVATLHKGCITATRTRLCGALGTIGAEDTEVHRLRPQDVRGKDAFSIEWDYFCGLRASGPLAAHYAGTENGLLKSVWPYPRACPDFARPGQSLADWGPWIDSAAIYAELWPKLPSGRLEELVSACGLQPEVDGIATEFCPPERRHYHAALYDALAGALLLAALARNPDTAALSLLQLLSYSTRNGIKRDQLQQGSLF